MVLYCFILFLLSVGLFVAQGKSEYSSLSISHSLDISSQFHFDLDEILKNRLSRSTNAQDALFLKFAFVNEPSDVSASKDQPVTLDCLTNLHNVKIRWRKDGSHLEIERSGGRLNVLQNGSLVISSVSGPRVEGNSDSDEGTYQCYAIVDDKWIFVSRKAKLGLTTLPRFEDQPENKTANLGDTVHFFCRTSGPSTPTIIWYRDNVALVPSENNRLTLIPVSGTLEIRNVQLTDQGVYKCKVEKIDTKYRISKEGRLTVRKVDALPEYSEPKFVLKPVSRVVRLGESLVLECSAIGYPDPQVQWLKNKKVLSLTGRAKVFGQGTLVIDGIIPEDAAVYTCQASGNDETVEQSATVVVTTPPVIVTPPKSIEAKEIADVEFDCKAEGNPSPSLTWLKNGEIIVTSDYFVIEGSKLKISGLIKGDQAVYQCLAENDAGSAQSSAQLVVEAAESNGIQGDNQVPSEPLGLKLSKVTSRSATLSWDSPVQSRGPLTGYSIFYKQEGLDRERVVNVTVSGAKDVTVQKLVPNMNYIFRIVGFNKNGPGVPSAPLKVKTEPENTVPSIVKNLRGKSLSSTSVEFRWDPPPQDTDSVSYYKLSYVAQTSADEHSDDDAQDDYSDAEDDEETEIQVKETHFVLHGLLPYTAYECRVEAVNSNGPGLPSEPIIVKTWSDVPTGPPRNVTAVPLTADSVTVRWSHPLEKQKNGPIVGYKIRYKVKDRGSRVHFFNVDGPKTHQLITSLDSGAAYNFRVAASTINGTGPYSPWISSELNANDAEDAHVLGPPTSLKVDAKGTEVHVSWTPPPVDEGIRGYLVGWGINVPDDKQERIPSTERSYSIKNLRPNKEYVISLRAFNKLGNGFPIYETIRTSSERQVSGPVRELKTPMEVRALTKSSNSILLSWTDQELPISMFGPQKVTDRRYYNVSWGSPYGGTIGRSKYVKSLKTSHTFDQLRPNTRYEFAVKLVMEGAESEWSMSAGNQTLSSAPTSAPTDLTLVQAPDNPTSVIINWMPPKYANGVIQKYVLYYTMDAKLPDNKWAIEAILGDRLSTTLTEKLVPDTEYTFKIQAVNDKGYGPVSSPPKVFRTTSRNSLMGDPSWSKPSRSQHDSYPDPGHVSDDDSIKGAASNKNTFTIIIVVVAVSFLLIVLLITFGIIHCRRRNKLRGYTAGVKKTSAGPGAKDSKPPPDLWIHHDHALELRNTDKNPPSGAPSLQDLKQMMARRSPTPPLPDVPRYHSLAVMPATSGTLGRNFPHHHVSSGSVDGPPYSARGYPVPQKTPQVVYTGPKGSQPRDGSSSPFGSGNISALTPTPPPQVPMIPAPPMPSDLNNSRTLPANSAPANRHSNPLKSFTVLTTPPPPPPLGCSPSAARVHSTRAGPVVDSPRHKTSGSSGVVIGTKARAMQHQQKASFNGPTYSSDSNAYSSGKETDSELPRSFSTEELTVQMRNLDNLMKDLNAISANEFDA